MRSPPARLALVELRPLWLYPVSWAMSCTATLGTGSFLWLPSGRLRMSVKDIPVLRGALPVAGAGPWNCALLSKLGSMGASAGVVWWARERLLKLGSS
jgi:hypothetical protein